MSKLLKPELPAHWVDMLETIFRQYCPDFEVWAYGSRVMGEHHEGSDLDLVLIHPQHPETTPCKYWLDVKSALAESELPIMVDVLDWARIPQAFRDEITEHKVKLLGPT